MEIIERKSNRARYKSEVRRPSDGRVRLSTGRSRAAFFSNPHIQTIITSTKHFPHSSTGGLFRRRGSVAFPQNKRWWLLELDCLAKWQVWKKPWTSKARLSRYLLGINGRGKLRLLNAMKVVLILYCFYGLLSGLTSLWLLEWWFFIPRDIWQTSRQHLLFAVRFILSSSDAGYSSSESVHLLCLNTDSSQRFQNSLACLLLPLVIQKSIKIQHSLIRSGPQLFKVALVDALCHLLSFW